MAATAAILYFFVFLWLFKNRLIVSTGRIIHLIVTKLLQLTATMFIWIPIVFGRNWIQDGRHSRHFVLFCFSAITQKPFDSFSWNFACAQIKGPATGNVQSVFCYDSSFSSYIWFNLTKLKFHNLSPLLNKFFNDTGRIFERIDVIFGYFVFSYHMWSSVVSGLNWIQDGGLGGHFVLKKHLKIRQKYIVQQIVTKLSKNVDTITSSTPKIFSKNRIQDGGVVGHFVLRNT
jgi:hypothetical protein